MKIAVIGGGIFGTTAALYAARAGHEVELFEALPELLMAASAVNQYRLHRGYHYPRSNQTAESALAAEDLFRKEYGDAVIDSGDHIYAISKEKSLVSGDEFLAFCDTHGLTYEVLAESELVNPDAVQLLIRASEARFDPDTLRTLVVEKLKVAGVTVHLNQRATAEMLDGFEKVIIATYANTSSVTEELAGIKETHQYEVCEKPVITLPERFGNTDLVVLDGPFMCVDPIGTSNRYVLGNVVHAIHSTNTGVRPEIPDALLPLLNKGLIENPGTTNFDAFIESGSYYIPLLKEAQHVGSLYTVRTVLPGLDATDARPTLVTAIDTRCIRIFSGKVGNSVLAAQDTLALL